LKLADFERILDKKLAPIAETPALWNRMNEEIEFLDQYRADSPNATTPRWEQFMKVNAYLFRRLFQSHFASDEYRVELKAKGYWKILPCIAISIGLRSVRS